MITDSKPDDPIQLFREAAANLEKAAKHYDDMQLATEQAHTAYIEAREIAHKATRAMHAFILSTNATPQE